MTFLHALLLGGAALMAVPVVLHLIMRRQPRHLEFPALRFLKERHTANRRQLRLRHLLLLALRCAVIGVLAFALARPVIQASGLIGDQEAPVAAALVFETNPRMLYRHQNQTRLESAQDTAQWLMSQFPRESEVAVLDSRSGGTAFAVDMSAAKQRVERLSTTAMPLPLSTVIEDALRLLSKSDKQRKELYIFTDLARSSWSPESARSLHGPLQETKDVGIYVVDVGVKEPRDAGIARVRLAEQVLSKNRPLRVQAEVFASGGGTHERTVELYLSDKQGEVPIKRNQSTVALEAGQSQLVDFQVGGLNAGIHQGSLKLVGDDGLPADDIAYFTIDVKPPWPVLIAAPPSADARFLREALAPYDWRAKGTAPFACDFVPMDELPKRDLQRYAVVCLLDPNPLPTHTWKQLSTFVANGGGLAIFLGRNATREAFNEPAPQEILPGKLVRQWRADQAALAPDNLQHPLLAPFRQLDSGVPWESGLVFRHWQLDSLAQGAGVILRYTDGQPAILEKPLGQGKVLAMTTPVSDPASRRDTWNILPTNDNGWVFVILAQEMVKYLAGGGDARFNYTAGETAVLHLPHEQPHAVFSLTTPRGDQIRQAVDAKQHALVVTATDAVGNYRLCAGGEETGVDLGFSVNLPPDICQFERGTEGDLPAIFGEAPFRVARNQAEISRDVNLGRVGRELYPFLIVLVGLLLGGEYLLANRFYRGHKSADASKGSPVTAATTPPRETIPPPEARNATAGVS